MKKYLFLVIPGLILMTVLVSNTLLQTKQMSAAPSSSKEREHAHYEKLLRKETFRDTTGRKYTKAELTKGIVIINFWASWCTPCLQEFPSLVQLVEKKKGKILVIAINTDEEDQKKEIKRITKKYKLNFPIVADVNSEFLTKFLISAIPISIVYKDGKVLTVSKGSKDFSSAEFLELID